MCWENISTAPKNETRIHLGFRYCQNYDVVAHFEDNAWRLSGRIELHGRPNQRIGYLHQKPHRN